MGLKFNCFNAGCRARIEVAGESKNVLLLLRGAHRVSRARPRDQNAMPPLSSRHHAQRAGVMFGHPFLTAKPSAAMLPPDFLSTALALGTFSM